MRLFILSSSFSRKIVIQNNTEIIYLQEVLMSERVVKLHLTNPNLEALKPLILKQVS